MGESVFTNPKNINLIKRIIELWTSDGDIVLDFFSGSATTAHSLIELNNEGATCRFPQTTNNLS